MLLIRARNEGRQLVPGTLRAVSLTRRLSLVGGAVAPLLASAMAQRLLNSGNEALGFASRDDNPRCSKRGRRRTVWA